jgi:quercetin dioxygenase-like cupin family protein
MDSLLESGLSLTEPQPECVRASFSSARQGAFTIAEDESGQAFLFERHQLPAVFIEVIRTAAGKIRGNHVHQKCDETLHVLSGEIELYLLCEHKEHVYKRLMSQGDVAIMSKGTPHALRSLQESECIVLFDKDPRGDRVRVPILKF